MLLWNGLQGNGFCWSTQWVIAHGKERRHGAWRNFELAMLRCYTCYWRRWLGVVAYFPTNDWYSSIFLADAVLVHVDEFKELLIVWVADDFVILNQLMEMQHFLLFQTSGLWHEHYMVIFLHWWVSICHFLNGTGDKFFTLVYLIFWLISRA